MYRIGERLLWTFFNTQKNIYDGKINILLIIQPGLTNIGNTTYDESTIRLTIGSTTIPHSSGIGYTISNNFVIKSVYLIEENHMSILLPVIEKL